MSDDTFFTDDIHSLKAYWENPNRAKKFLKGGTRVGAIHYLLRRIEVDVHNGSWMDSGTGAGFVQSQIDPTVAPTLFVGLDFSVTMLLTQINPYGERVAGSAFNPPFRRRSFKVVTNIFSLSDYPEIADAFAALGQTVEDSGTFNHLDYGDGDGYWIRRQKMHGIETPNGEIIVGNINLRSLDQITSWTPRSFRITHQKRLEFEVDGSAMSARFDLPDRINRVFIFTEFYKAKSTNQLVKDQS